MSYIVFIANKSTPNGKDLAERLQTIDAFQWRLGNSIEEFGGADAVKDADVIVPVVFAGGNMSLLTDLWPLCPKLRWVHSLAAGVEALVPQMLALPGGPEIPLTNAKGAYSRPLAEYALAAMLHFNKQVPRLQSLKRSKTSWDDKFTMNELYGKTVGFVGFGDIAQTTVPYCKAFGMKVLALRQSSNASGNDLADKIFYSGENKLGLFQEADFVICSLPGGAPTKHFCGKAEFDAMKPTAFFLSIGRGTCVDEVALVSALESNSIAGAALDVFDKEPLPADSPLWNCENLLLSPHNADLTTEYIKVSWELFLSKREAFLSPDFKGFDVQVDKAKGY